MPTRIARGTGGLVSMIEDVVQIAQEWGGIRETRPASHGRTGCRVGPERRGPGCRIRERHSKSPLTDLSNAALFAALTRAKTAELARIVDFPASLEARREVRSQRSS